jgi:RNA polymerase sigma-70 factor, ECF subfamily
VAASTHFPRLVGPEAIDRVGVRPSLSTPVEERTGSPAEITLVFDDVYRAHFAFVWRSARRLGVREASLDDVVQEVFVIVHRRLADFEGRSSIRTWLFGITLRVARDHRRSTARRSPLGDAIDPDTLRATSSSPAESMEKAEAVRLLHTLLDELDDERREIFVMAELEQMTMPDIATTLGVNVNTAYARLRAARQMFEDALARQRIRDEFNEGRRSMLVPAPHGTRDVTAKERLK